MAYGNKYIQSFYNYSPAAVKNIFASAYGFHQRRSRYGSYFNELSKFLKESENWGNKNLHEYQQEKLEHFIKDALLINNYYSKRIAYFDFNGNINSLPVLSKSEVRNNLTEIYSNLINHEKIYWINTSGTTGKSLEIPQTQKCFENEYAFRNYHFSLSGVSFIGRDKIVVLAGQPVKSPQQKKPPFWIHDWSNNHLIFSSYHMSKENLKYYVKEFESFKPSTIMGYPSSIYMFALAYKKFGKGSHTLKSIYTSSESLFQFQREMIEHVFQVKVFNYYGNAERSAYIMECEKGELHVMPQYSFVEVLDENNLEVNPGESGRLICTGFSNEACPLIRYDVGDIVTVAENQSSKCGRGGLILESIEGRKEDYIVTPDGRFIGRLDHLFKDTKNVIEAQIVQSKPNEVTLRIVKDENYTFNDEFTILREARIRLNNDMNIYFEYVDEIPRTKNGKFRFIESRIEHKEIFGTLIRNNQYN